MKRYDAVVLGAGPAGSSAAFFLAEAGLRVAIVERAAFPRRKVCGEFVSATTLPVLDAMGVGETLREAGGLPTRKAGLYLRDETFVSPMPPLDGPDPWGRTMARAVLDPTILAAAQEKGVDVYQPYKAVGMESGHIVTVEREGRHERLEAPFVVAAHGSWEVGALPTQPARSHRPDDVLAFKGFFHGATFDLELMILAAFPGGYGGMVHRDRDTVGLSFCVRRDVLERCRARYRLPTAWDSLLRHVCAHNRGVAEAVEGARLEAPAKAAGPLRPGIRPRYEGGVFRVGNAAGEAHPTVAEGISMAIQSGYLLGQALSTGGLETAGERYTRAWDAQFRGRIRTAALLARLCMSPSIAAAAVPVLRALPGLVTVGASLTGKTKTVLSPQREDLHWA